MRLFHGSDVAIPQPEASRGTGFADLGHGFYLTDDYAVAQSRARTRARHEGAPAGVVSVFELEEDCVSWATWGTDGLAAADVDASAPFGLRFELSERGLAAWMRYIKACRANKTDVEGLGTPAIVRAWIATEEVEMACSGLIEAEELAPLMDADELVVQYCVLSQDLINAHLSFVEAEKVPAR